MPKKIVKATKATKASSVTSKSLKASSSKSQSQAKAGSVKPSGKVSGSKAAESKASAIKMKSAVSAKTMAAKSVTDKKAESKLIPAKKIETKITQSEVTLKLTHTDSGIQFEEKVVKTMVKTETSEVLSNVTNLSERQKEVAAKSLNSANLNVATLGTSTLDPAPKSEATSGVSSASSASNEAEAPASTPIKQSVKIRPRDRMIRPMMKAINGGKAQIPQIPVKYGPDGKPLPRFPGDGISARALSLAELSNYDFKVGDHAVYPSYGVGTVVAVETKEIMGSKCDFYVVQIRETGMKVMVPKNNVASVGLRPVISKEEASKVLEILKTTEVRIDNQTWNRRYREYMEKIKTGSVYEIAEVLRDLFLLKVDKELSYGERNMLDTARKLLMRELTLAVDKDELSKQEEVKQIFGL